MTCSCTTTDTEAAAKVHGLLATAGLREIVEQTEEATRVMSESIRHLRKADRATALGFGPEVVALHRDAGERGNRRCRRQFRAVIEAIDDRVGRDDWPQLVADCRRAYEEHQGREQLDDARADLRAALLDMDSLPSTVTGRVLGLADEAIDRVTTDGLSAGVQLLREKLEDAMDLLDAPEMGRQAASPDTAAYVICSSATLAIFIIACIICFAAYLCWCCFFVVILAACLVNIGACAGLLAV